jgi:ATP-dependent DNA helicase RecQ
MESKEILSLFQGERRDFLAALFKQSVKARTWFDIDPVKAAHTLGAPRNRVIRALDWLGEQKMLEVKAAGIRHRYRKLKVPTDQRALVRSLNDRLRRREESEISRLGQVLQWAGHDSCQTELLVSHFGERLDRPCGHCSYCLEGRSVIPERRVPDIDAALWKKATSFREEHLDVLTKPRSFARFLCGVSSPHLRRAKLTRHPLFGACSKVPFAALMKAATER